MPDLLVSPLRLCAPARRYQHVSDLGTDVQNITAAGPGNPPLVSQPPTSVTLPAPVMPPAPPPEETSDCRILPAFILAFLFGIFGAHRFYVGKIGTAFLQLFTFGGLGIWATIDWILSLCKAFKDKKGRKLTKWT